MEIAIVVVAYNRVESMSRLLDSLKRASYPDGQSITLIISVDKSNTDVVEKSADNFTWPYGEKIVDKHDQNLGLRAHMISLGKWLEQYEAIVVLEDDVVVCPSFYYYATQTVNKYYEDDDIAGISLYNFHINYQTGAPFEPLKNAFDVFLMNCAMSWGEIWMRKSWNLFHNWYLSHENFCINSNLPATICSWNEKSWLKYHTRYCIEENKFFVYPYVSLSTNFSDTGVHNDGTGSSVYQVSMQSGVKKCYMLPDSKTDLITYDGFFENRGLYNAIGYSTNDICLDLQRGNNNNAKCKYWLTTKKLDYKIVRSYGLNYRPIEQNVYLHNKGNEIFLYDTTSETKIFNKTTRHSMLYPYYLSNAFSFIRTYGFCNTIKDFFSVVTQKLVDSFKRK